MVEYIPNCFAVCRTCGHRVEFDDLRLCHAVYDDSKCMRCGGDMIVREIGSGKKDEQCRMELEQA